MSIPTLLNVPRLMENFKNGGGIPYSEIGEELPEAIERFFRPGYVHQLNQNWFPAVPGLIDRLKAGAMVADVGCGCGQSTAVMAKAFPKSTIIGIDNDVRSIERAKALSASQGLKNVEFLTVPADRIPKNRKFDLVCAFDCVHDMVDPKGTLKAIRESLADDGIFFWLEPNASENPLENRNPVGKVFSSISPLHCMTVSLAHGGEALGTVIGESGARRLAREAGFSRFEKAAIDNPFNQLFVLEK
jgi:2-polyprenyl-3-methyl-5-hydroxy-6-metoxy-1,4-benzoquinol methylase